MSIRKVLALASVAIGCEGPPPRHEELLTITSPAALGDVVWMGDTTWFVLGPDGRGDERPRTLCRLVVRDLTCATIPASHLGARLVEPGPDASALVALASAGTTLYVEPFTWKTLRRTDEVLFDQHAVVRRDGTIWVETDHNLLVFPPTGKPHRWFERSVSQVAISAAGVLWTEYRGAEAIATNVQSAMFVRDRLGPPREHPGIERWALGDRYDVCQSGTTIGLIELNRHDLVRFELDSDRVDRIHVGEDHYLRCGRHAVAATPLKFSTAWTGDVATCDRDGCQKQSATLKTDHFGAFSVAGKRVFAVGSTNDDRLVMWKVGEEPRYLEVPPNNSLSLASAAALPDGGALVQFIYGELFVFDHQGRPRKIELHWLNEPLR